MAIVSAELVVDLKKHGSIEQAERALYLAFRRLKRRARRYFGRFEYFTFVEISQRGWPRLLLLSREENVPRSWLSRNWRECGGTRITNVRLLGSLKDTIQALQPYHSTPRRRSAESRRNARFSPRFFDDLGRDLRIGAEDVAYWREYQTHFVLPWLLRGGPRYIWPSLFLGAVGLGQGVARADAIRQKR